MNNTWIFPAAALVVGGIGGFITGKQTGGPSDDKDAVKDIREAARRSSRSGNRPDSRGGDAGGKHGSRISGVEDISRIPGNSDRIKALLEFYAGLTTEQLAEEARKLEKLPINERIMASILLFGQWAEKDPTAAMAFSNTMGFTGGFVRPTILQSWASVDPANAAKYYASNPREFGMMGLMGGRGGGPFGGMGPSSIIAGEWARQDPAAAMQWAQSLTAHDKTQAISGVVGEIAKTDPKKAADMLATIDGGDAGNAYRTVAAQYGAKNFAEAQAWIRTLPADQQAEAMAAAIGGLSGTDPRAAAKQITQMEDGEAKDGVTSRVVQDWARTDPQAAAEFLKQQSSPDAQQGAMRELMSSWVSQNPSAALAYANSYEAGPVRDSALQSYIWNNNSAAPAELVKIAESITDENDRGRTIGIAASRWMREDETAAKAYVEQSTAIPDDAKQRILEGRSPGGPGGGRGGPPGGPPGGLPGGRPRN